ARALAAETPTELVQRHVVLRAQFRRSREVIRGRERTDASSKDGDLAPRAHGFEPTDARQMVLPAGTVKSMLMYSPYSTGCTGPVPLRPRSPATSWLA